jgi:hypothetical protein
MGAAGLMTLQVADRPLLRREGEMRQGRLVRWVGQVKWVQAVSG